MPVKDVSPVIAEARKRWQRSAEAFDAQRKAIVAAKKFRALDQWPEQIKLAREGAASIAGQPPQPARPCLVVDRLSQPLRIESNRIKNADFGFDVLPDGFGADQETASILKGYLRRVQNQSRVESPIEWAADSAIESGIGWFRIRTRYVYERWDGDPDDPQAYDQELVLERIPNSLSVYDDPSAMKPTRSDSLFRFIVEDMDKDACRDRFQLSDEDMRGLEEFQGTGDMASWVTKDTIRVAEYWRVTHETKTISTTVNGKTVQRVVRTPVVKGSLINAVKELEVFDWVGSRIPSVPILGEEINVDGKPILRGIISLGMDAQRMVNYTYSAAIEIFALSSKQAPRVPAAAIAQYKGIWDTRNVYNYAYLPYDQYDADGKELRPPQDDTTEPPIQAAVALMRTSEESVKTSTSTGDASLGNTNPNEKSGRALEALQMQGELANSNFALSTKIAMLEAADQMIEVIPKITRPGQVWQILGIDDKPENVIVGQPFEVGPDGMPRPVDVPPEVAKLKDNLYKFYDPTKGRYAVTVTIGKATATRQQEGSKALGELIPHLPPEMAAAVTPDYVKQLSFPGAQSIAEKLEATLPPHLQGKKDQQNVPPEIQAQMTQMQGQLQQAQQIIETDQVKQQATIETAKIKESGEMQRAEMEIAAKLKIAEMDNATKLQIEEYKLRGMAIQKEIDAREKQLGAEQQQAHDAGMKAMDQAHQSDEAERGREHESAEAREAREAASMESEASRAHDAEMARQAAQQAQQQGAGA